MKMDNEYWNRCKIVKVISNPNIPGSEEWLLVDNEDSTFRFEVFASCCRKFEKNGNFNFEKFKNGSRIEIKIEGHYVAHWNKDMDNEYWNEGFLIMKNKFNDEKYFVLGKIIKEAPSKYEGKRGRLLKSRNLYVHFIDNEGLTKEGDNVLLSIYGVEDLK